MKVVRWLENGDMVQQRVVLREEINTYCASDGRSIDELREGDGVPHPRPSTSRALQSWSASDLSAELGVTVISSLDISLVAANLPPDLPPSQVTASPPPSSPPHPLMPLDDASAASDLTGSTLANCESEAGCATTLRFEVILAAIGIFVIGACIILLCAYRMRASCRRQHALGSSRDNVSIVTSPSAVNVQLHPTKQPRVAHPSPYSDCVEHLEQLEPLSRTSGGGLSFQAGRDGRGALPVRRAGAVSTSLRLPTLQKG